LNSCPPICTAPAKSDITALTLAAAPPADAQTARTLTISASVNGGPACTDCRANEGDRVDFTVALSGITAGVLWTHPYSPAGTATFGVDYDISTLGPGNSEFAAEVFTASDLISRIRTLRITDDSAPEPDETITVTMRLNPALTTTTDTVTIVPLTVTIAANDGYVAPVAPGPVADDPAARAERLEAPVAAVARGVGQLAADAITQRVAGNARLGLWASGGHLSADGEHEGIIYDGHTNALHLGVDTTWRDGLIGVSIARSNGDVDFNNTDNLETTVTSVHPYLTRPFNGAQLWTTIGYGTGDAELKEPDTVIKTDVKVLTAGFGLVHEQSDLLTATIGALFNRAKLDSATGDNKTLPAVTVSTLRVTAGAEAGWSHGAWRPFLTVHLRHAAGDGDDGGAADLGGGVEYQTPTVQVRLEGAGHVQGTGPDENRLSLTAGKTAGRLNLGLTVTADNGLNTANLLSGEWRF